MSEQAEYTLQIDWDKDGYFCDGVLPSDPLNLIENAATLRGVAYRGTSTNSAILYRDPLASDPNTKYGGGYRRWAVDTAGEALGGIWIGRNAASNLHIPVLASTQYTFSIWLTQSISVLGNKDFTIVAGDQNLGLLGAQAITISSFQDLTQFSCTFTTGGDTTHVNFTVQKRTNTDQVFFFAAFPMLVLGATAPTAFNAGSATNAYDNVTPYVEDVTWQYGLLGAEKEIAQPASMTVRLNNNSGVWTPENPASPFTTELSKTVLCRLWAEYDGVTYQQCVLTVEQFMIEAGTVGGRTVMLMARDPMLRLLDSDYLPDLQLDVRIDEVLERVFDTVILGYPYPANYWMLGVEGSSELGETTFLYFQDITDFDEADTTLEFAGDLTGSGAVISAQAFIRPHVAAELGGMFYFDVKDGRFHFHNRTRDTRSIGTPVNPGALEQDEPPAYVWGDDLVNDVTVQYYPRSIGADNAVLFSMENVPVAISAGATRKFTARYRDPDDPGATVAAHSTVPIRIGDDYRGYDDPDGLGVDKTNQLTVVATYHATSAEVEITNGDAGTVYVTFFQIIGVPLTAHSQESVNARDITSVARHGEHKKSIDLPALGDAQLGALYANYYMQRYKNPIGRIAAASYTARTPESMEYILSLTIGDYIEIYDTWLNNSITYYKIVGAIHRVAPQRDHWVRWFVQPMDRAVYWILGDADLSILGETTRLSL